MCTCNNVIVHVHVSINSISCLETSFFERTVNYIVFVFLDIQFHTLSNCIHVF